MNTYACWCTHTHSYTHKYKPTICSNVGGACAEWGLVDDPLHYLFSIDFSHLKGSGTEANMISIDCTVCEVNADEGSSGARGDEPRCVSVCVCVRICPSNGIAAQATALHTPWITWMFIKNTTAERTGTDLQVPDLVGAQFEICSSCFSRFWALEDVRWRLLTTSTGFSRTCPRLAVRVSSFLWLKVFVMNIKKSSRCTLGSSLTPDERKNPLNWDFQVKSNRFHSQCVCQGCKSELHSCYTFKVE